MSDGLRGPEVARIAALARLALTGDESRQMAAQLGRILAFAAEVSSLDTSPVQAEARWLAQQPCERADQVCPSMQPDRALANAPEQGTGLFLTPRVLPRD
jgi:aspartyl-tRNA(Asn)/glutamyl-tRNA(Gln) amidotransferase subunit C